MEYAAWMIEAHTCQKGFKQTRLAVQMEIEKRTGKESSFIRNKPKCPYEFLYLWDIYNKALKGCERLGYIELQAFNQLSGFELTGQETDILIEVDILRRKGND